MLEEVNCLYKDGSLWKEADVNELGEKYSWNYKKLIDDFPEDKLYLHPVKLSKWVKK